MPVLMTDLRDRIATVLRDNLAVSRFEADSMADAATKELRRRECAESYQSDTEKHLRDRVAQTLYRRYAPQLGMADNPWEDEHSLTQEMWREDADAVIAELGLRREDLGGFRVPGYGHRGYRYVTDWTADD